MGLLSAGAFQPLPGERAALGQKNAKASKPDPGQNAAHRTLASGERGGMENKHKIKGPAGLAVVFLWKRAARDGDHLCSEPAPQACPTRPPPMTTGAGHGLAPGLGCGCQLVPAGWVVQRGESPPWSAVAPGLPLWGRPLSWHHWQGRGCHGPAYAKPELSGPRKPPLRFSYMSLCVWPGARCQEGPHEGCGVSGRGESVVAP